MAESQARKRSREAKGQTAPSKAVSKSPLQISLLGHDLVLDAMSLTIDEKQTYRRFAADLGDDADATDIMFVLAVVLIQRIDPELSWADAKKRVTWQMMLDAIAAGKPAEADHPQ